MPHSDRPIAVIGAGIVGLAIACRLSETHDDVVLIDRQEPGRECSYGNAGHIATEQVAPLASPDTLRQAPKFLFRRDGPLSIRSAHVPKFLPWLARFIGASRQSAFDRGTTALASLQHRAMLSFRALLGSAGLDSLLISRGHILLAEQARSRHSLLAERSRLAGHGVETEWLDARQVRDIAPDLTPDIQGALFFPGTGHVADPYRVSQGLADAFMRAGGRIVRAEVSRIGSKPDGAFDLDTGSGPLTCERLVLATGAWSRSLAAQLGHKIPVDTERGYHLTARGWSGRFDIPVASYERKTIMTPLDSGLRITGFVEFGGLTLPPRDRHFDSLRGHLRALLPAAEFPEFERWMGFRPSLPDHLPVIGRARRHRNAIFAFGHQHLGLTLSGITADIVSALIAGQAPPVDIEPFRCDRF